MMWRRLVTLKAKMNRHYIQTYFFISCLKCFNLISYSLIERQNYAKQQTTIAWYCLKHWKLHFSGKLKPFKPCLNCKIITTIISLNWNSNNSEIKKKKKLQFAWQFNLINLLLLFSISISISLLMLVFL